MRNWLSTAALASCALAFLAAAPADAQVRFGPEVAWGDDLDLGLGGRVTADIDAFSESGSEALQELRGIGEFIWYVDPIDNCDDCSAWEINLNGAVPLNLGETDNDFYAGAGLNIARISIDTGVDIPGFDEDVSDTEVGLNLLGGLNFELGALAAFAEAGLRVSGSEQFVIAGGLTFGGGG